MDVPLPPAAGADPDVRRRRDRRQAERGGYEATGRPAPPGRGSGPDHDGGGRALYPSFTLGAHGAIAAILTAVPRLCVQLWDAVQAGDHKQALALHEKLLPVWNAIAKDNLPANVKHCLSLQAAVAVSREPRCRRRRRPRRVRSGRPSATPARSSSSRRSLERRRETSLDAHPYHLPLPHLPMRPQRKARVRAATADTT